MFLFLDLFSKELLTVGCGGALRTEISSDTNSARIKVYGGVMIKDSKSVSSYI